MAEVLDQLSELARERARSLERAAETLAGEAEGILLVASDTAQFVRFLSVMWTVLQMRLRKGGVPAKRVVQECDVLLGLIESVAKRLALISKVWQERHLPADVAQPIFQELQDARQLLDSTEPQVRRTRDGAAAPARVSADPDLLKQRIQQADENAQWLKLADAVAQMRQRDAQQTE